MQTNSISRSSSTITIDGIRTPSVTSSDAATCETKATQTNFAIQHSEGITPQKFESAAIKKRILKFFCCI